MRTTAGDGDRARDASGVSDRYLLRLDDPRCSDPRLTGSKAATLSELRMAGFPVPDGVVLTVRAFEDVLAFLDDPSEELVRSLPLLPSVETTLMGVVPALGNGPLAVRSSGVAEDLAGASFAGQYETVLGVQGAEELVDAVRHCWASAFSERVSAYREQQAMTETAPMAVLIQRQVAAEAAGVLFTADPMTGSRDVAVVDAVAGLGDRLMSGEADAERWRITDGGAVRATPGDAALSRQQVRSLEKMGREVEARFSMPQDIEWAIEDGRPWLLQARPITGLDEKVEPVPVAIDAPDGFWERDASHWPAPHSPLGRSITYPLANRFTTRMCEEFGMLAEGVVLTDIGGWHYARIVPLGGKDRPTPPAWLVGVVARLNPAMRRRVKAAVEAVRTDKARRIIDRWYEEWQPDLMEHAEALARTDRTGLSDEGLLDYFEQILSLFEDGLSSHLLIITALMVETFALADVCRELLGWDDDRVFQMLAGLSHRSTDPARLLAAMANEARSQGGVVDLLAEIGPDTLELVGSVAPAFFSMFEKHRWSPLGIRALSRDPADATLADQPELLLGLVANQVGGGFDLGKVDATNGSRRQALTEEARVALASRPAEDRQRFEAALERAGRAYPLREDNVFYALQTPVGLVRFAALEMGARLADRGSIAVPDDVFFLEWPELKAAFIEGTDQRVLARRRKGERAWVLAHPGPEAHGKPPGSPPSLRHLPWEVRQTTEAFFWSMNRTIDKGTFQQTAEEGIRGIAASGGRYTGTVRVILDEKEFDKLQAGDVVVCPVTQPTWSVLFPSMGAVVTDSGGTLSHPAIIAREFGIPAVVATGNATSLLHDGQLVTVDGSAGLVTVEG